MNDATNAPETPDPNPHPHPASGTALVPSSPQADPNPGTAEAQTETPDPLDDPAPMSLGQGRRLYAQSQATARTVKALQADMAKVAAFLEGMDVRLAYMDGAITGTPAAPPDPLVVYLRQMATGIAKAVALATETHASVQWIERRLNIPR